MSGDHGPYVVTFYSYKGGVGRTLLLANAAVALGELGRRVLAIDLDVEAPGMHRIPGFGPAENSQTGLLEWLHDWEESGCPAEPSKAQLVALAKLVRPSRSHRGVWLLPAFGDGTRAADAYGAIDWHRVLVEQEEATTAMFRSVLAHLGAERDYVLLDSRTGVTDLGGLLTAVLPHATVFVANYSEQNTAGIVDIWKALDAAAQDKVEYRPALGPLQRLLVASPVPASESEAAELRRKVWDEFFAVPLRERWVEVPFDAKLLVREEILATPGNTGALATAYRCVADRIERFRGEFEAARRAEAAEDAKFPGEADNESQERHSAKRMRRSFKHRVRAVVRLLGYEVDEHASEERLWFSARRQGGLRDYETLVACTDAKFDPNVWVARLRRELEDARDHCVRVDAMIVTSGRIRPPEAAGPDVRFATLDELERGLIDFEPYLAALRLRFEQSPLARTYVNQRLLAEDATNEREKGVDALMRGAAWADGRGKRLWLVLGDYGTGKSTFVERLAYDLAVRALDRQANPDAPIPLAIDLKKIPKTSLDDLIAAALAPHSRNPHQPVNVAAVRHLMAEGRVVLLLDSFDETGLASVGNTVEERFRDLVQPTAQESFSPRGNRVLVTCRTHFFRDQQQVKDTATGRYDIEKTTETSLGETARRFDAAIDELLLFSDEQIRDFLVRHLGEKEAARAAEFIERTYDLKTLAPRPVLLDMIVQSLPALMKVGGFVTPAGLYDRYTSQWLEDRSGRNLLTRPDARKRLLRRLAFELWGRAGNRIHHRELIDVLRACPASETAGLDLDRIDIELRTAAFLTRSPDGHYCFSHKSFREFFYAAFLVDAAGDVEAFRKALDTDVVSPEVVAFLTDLAGDAQRDALIDSLRGVLAGPYRARASENALRVAVWLGRKLSRQLVPEGADLTGARLAGIDLIGVELPNVRLAGADLSGAVLDNNASLRLFATLAPGTRVEYAKALRLVGTALGLADPSPAALLEHLATLGPAGSDAALADLRDHWIAARLAGATLNTRFAAVRALTVEANRARLLDWTLNPVRVRYRRVRREAPPEETYLALLRAADGPREESILRLLGDAGLRVVEVATLRASDVVRSPERVTGVETTLKGDMVGRTLRPVGPKTGDALARWIEESGATGDEGLYPGQREVRRIVSRIARRAGTGHVHPHLLRHRAATRATELGIPLAVTQRLMRHADPRQTSEYVTDRGEYVTDRGQVAEAAERVEGEV